MLSILLRMPIIFLVFDLLHMGVEVFKSPVHKHGENVAVESLSKDLHHLCLDAGLLVVVLGRDGAHLVLTLVCLIMTLVR